jgi:hypothetical protein
MSLPFPRCRAGISARSYNPLLSDDAMVVCLSLAGAGCGGRRTSKTRSTLLSAFAASPSSFLLLVGDEVVGLNNYASCASETRILPPENEKPM